MGEDISLPPLLCLAQARRLAQLGVYIVVVQARLRKTLAIKVVARRKEVLARCFAALRPQLAGLQARGSALRQRVGQVRLAAVHAVWGCCCN